MVAIVTFLPLLDSPLRSETIVFIVNSPNSSCQNGLKFKSGNPIELLDLNTTWNVAGILGGCRTRYNQRTFSACSASNTLHHGCCVASLFVISFVQQIFLHFVSVLYALKFIYFYLVNQQKARFLRHKTYPYCSV